MPRNISKWNRSLEVRVMMSQPRSGNHIPKWRLVDALSVALARWKYRTPDHDHGGLHVWTKARFGSVGHRYVWCWKLHKHIWRHTLLILALIIQTFYWPRSTIVINIHEPITEIAVIQRVPLVEQELLPFRSTWVHPRFLVGFFSFLCSVL